MTAVQTSDPSNLSDCFHRVHRRAVYNYPHRGQCRRVIFYTNVDSILIECVGDISSTNQGKWRSGLFVKS